MKNKFNYNLLNILMLLIIFYMIYLLKDFSYSVFSVLINIFKPFIIGFVLAYIFYPFIKILRKKLPKSVSIIVLISILILIITFFIISIIPIFTNQLSSLFNGIIKFINNMDNTFYIDLTPLKKSITKSFNIISNDIGKYISNGAISIVNSSINFISNFIISIVTFIYFLVYMDNIRETIKILCHKKSSKFFDLIKELDNGMSNYFKGLSLCIIIQFIEYTFIFYLIGHPNFLLLGIICSITTVIPYFGGIVANVVAVITASVVSSKLLILTLIVAFICPNIDGYLISPKVYGKTNELNPLVSIFAVFSGGVLNGVIGILIAIPVAIIIQTIYKYYKKEIIKKISNIKG